MNWSHALRLFVWLCSLNCVHILQIVEEDIENYATVIKALHDMVDQLGDEVCLTYIRSSVLSYHPFAPLDICEIVSDKYT